MCLWQWMRRRLGRSTCTLVVWHLSLLGWGCVLTGCSDQVQAPSTAQIIEFENAGPRGPAVDLDRVAEAKLAPGPYRVVSDDVLQVEMPRILDPHTSETATAIGGRETYSCRVSEVGTIVLPVIGALTVAGRPLTEIESAIANSYYPKYVTTEPPVYVNVLEYKKHRVSVVGAVMKPGIYALRHDQMSLVGLLMEAGGIVDEGAALIKINRRGRARTKRLEASHVAAPKDIGKEVARPYRLADWRRSSTGERGLRTAETGAMPQIVFLRDGPLNTTGWLALIEARGVTERRWLDIGNRLQRQEFLCLLGARLGKATTAEIESRLSRLAQLLDSHPMRQGVHLAAYGSGWGAVSHQRTANLVGYDSALSSPIGADGAGYATETASNGAVATVVLPVRGMRVPFADVALQEGDSIVVEPPRAQFVSVLGLVKNPGHFPYPLDVQYTLAEAVALAGGLDLIADPRYVSVYRLKADGTVAGLTLQLVDPEDQEQLTENLALRLKPGDVVSVEHTQRTRTNTFFDRIFRVSLGLYFRPESVWGDDD